MEQDWTFYFAQLAHQELLAEGKPTTEPEVTPGKPASGYYRTRANDAVVIWRDGDACRAILHRRDGQDRETKEEHYIDGIFSQCCRSAVPDEDYERFVATRQWPDDIEKPAPRGIGDNSKLLEPHESVRAQINDLLDQARAWLKSIGGKARDKTEAKKAANYSDEFSRLEKQAGEEQKRLKKPILEAGRKIDAAWKPVIGEASDAKRMMKKAVEDYLIEEKRRDEARELEERQKAQEEGRLMSARPSATVVGRVSLRTVKELVVTDLRALAQHYLSQNMLRIEIVDALQTCARADLSSGTPVPGAELKSKQVAA
jgi:hypothetical protein